MAEVAISESNSPSRTNIAFGVLMETIIGGYDKVSLVVEKGTGHALLAAGLVMLTATMTAELTSLFGGGLVARTLISPLEFSIMLFGSIIVLFGGTAVKIWDRFLYERAKEREFQARLKAAEVVTGILSGPQAIEATKYVTT